MSDDVLAKLTIKPLTDAVRESVRGLPQPAYWEQRTKVWDEARTAYRARLAELPEKHITLRIKTADGFREAAGNAHVTTPQDLCPELARRAFCTRVRYGAGEGSQIWDLCRPLTGSGTLEYLSDWLDRDVRYTFWHSSAHLLGMALELYYGGDLATGPPLDRGGFFYDMRLGAERSAAVGDFEPIEQIVQCRCERRLPPDQLVFERIELLPEVALRMFEQNPFKRQIIESIPADEPISAYRIGPFIDLCEGPHLPSAALIRVFRILRLSGAYWKGQASGTALTRMTAISFPGDREAKRHAADVVRREQNSHLRLGPQLRLFMMHPYSPGEPFFLPAGSSVINRLRDLLRKQYRIRGFQEVRTPTICHQDLWKTSGHYKHYVSNLFAVQRARHTAPGEAAASDAAAAGAAGDAETAPDAPPPGEAKAQAGESGQSEYFLKPINCPTHCLIFKRMVQSYRHLPLRLADFGVLHRHELSGALHGLTRVIKFQQDDAHVFCARSMLESELAGAIDFLMYVYGLFGFRCTVELSTRSSDGDKWLGEPEEWVHAEQALFAAIGRFRTDVTIMSGEGAFYGPKLDFHMQDCMGRSHQCGTIQVDFQLPKRFELEYKGTDGQMHTPIIIHRAIFGSFERFFAILVEHYGLRWPLWLAPYQLLVATAPPSGAAGTPQGAALDALATRIAHLARVNGLYCELDTSSERINKKIRSGHALGCHLMLVVGANELAQSCKPAADAAAGHGATAPGEGAEDTLQGDCSAIGELTAAQIHVSVRPKLGSEDRKSHEGATVQQVLGYCAGLIADYR